MNKLEECRAKIDEIDTKIIDLYEERMLIVKEVINYKINHHMNVLDQNRENDMLGRNLNRIKNDDLKKYYKDVLIGFLSASKSLQNDILNKKK